MCRLPLWRVHTMSIEAVPAPTATLSMTVAGEELGKFVGVDLVCDPVEGQARVLIVIPDSPFRFRLDFTRAELAALMDELCELADVADLQDATGASQAQPELFAEGYGGSA